MIGRLHDFGRLRPISEIIRFFVEN